MLRLLRWIDLLIKWIMLRTSKQLYDAGELYRSNLKIRRVPQHRMHWYAPRLVYHLLESNEDLDDNLQVCESSSQDVPAPGDTGGVWYCGGGLASPIQSCSDARGAGKTFGIPQGLFADFRNFSSSSSVVATPTKSIITVTVTTDVGDNTSSATDLLHTTEPSCPAHTGSQNTLSGRGRAIASIAIGGVSAILIAFGIGILSERRRAQRASSVQTHIEGSRDIQRYSTRETERVGKRTMENLLELPNSECLVPEFGNRDSRGAAHGG